MPTGAIQAASDSSSADMARVVQERLDAYRRNLLAGRGPGISEEEWLRNSQMRAAVGGVPTAVGRESLRLRTLRIRGECEEFEAEAEWAAAQFPAENDEFAALASSTGRRRPSAARVAVVLGLLGTAIWRSLHARARRRRR